MPRSASGISTFGRQVVLPVIDSTDVVAGVLILVPDPPLRRWGTIRLERNIAPNVSLTYSVRGLWTQGDSLVFPLTSVSNYQLVVIWREAGVPWQASSG